MHELWKNATVYGYNQVSCKKVKINEYYMFVWAGEGRESDPQVLMSLDQFHTYDTFEIYIHKTCDDNNTLKHLDDPLIRSKILNKDDVKTLGLSKLNPFLIIKGYNVYFGNVPRLLSEEAYDILKGNKVIKENPTGGYCRKCNLYDDYAPQGDDGKVICYQCY